MQDRFFIYHGHIIKFYVNADEVSAFLIHENFSFPTIKEENKVEQSTFMSVQSNMHFLVLN